MGKQKEKAKKEKPLEKMTAKELREIALSLEGVVGVHAMNKAELIKLIKEERGIADQGGKRKTVDVRSIKERIRQLRDKRQQAKDEGNSKYADILRRRISRLKKRTRRAA